MELGTMQWSWMLSFWRRATGAEIAGPGCGAVRNEPASSDEWVSQLIEQGVSVEWARCLATRLAPLHADLGPGSAEAILRAASVAFQVQAGAHSHVERSMRDVREVERLLGAFGGELKKLDEVLEVLAAYAQRMREKPAKSANRTLH